MTIETALQLLDEVLEPKKPNHVEILVFTLCWENKTYREIADSSQYDYEYVKYVGSHLWKKISRKWKVQVTKKNFQAIFSQYISEEDSIALSTELVVKQERRFADWGDLTYGDFFVGREKEIGKIKSWIEKENYQLITILGVGGIGKTEIAKQVIKKVEDKFNYIFCRSLERGLLLKDLLKQFIIFVSGSSKIYFPETIYGLIDYAIEFMKNHYCLLVLDNLDSILSSESEKGEFNFEYEDYELFFDKVISFNSPSCVMVTSREKNLYLDLKETKSGSVKSLKVSNLDKINSNKILIDRQLPESSLLIDRTFGNPHAIVITSNTIKSAFGNNVRGFLSGDNIIYGDIASILKEQFIRLSEVEKELIYRLVKEENPPQIKDIPKKNFTQFNDLKMMAALESLIRRSLIEIKKEHYIINPLFKKYILQLIQEK